jgi:hypothetical protein
LVNRAFLVAWVVLVSPVRLVVLVAPVVRVFLPVPVGLVAPVVRRPVRVSPAVLVVPAAPAV